MDKLKTQMAKLGWLEIDYKKPIDQQVSIGDYLITTGMFIFDTTNCTKNIECNEKVLENRLELFRVLDAEDNIVRMLFDNTLDEDEQWFEPQGRIFIKKINVEYIIMKIPSFLVDKITSMGGKLITETPQ